MIEQIKDYVILDIINEQNHFFNNSIINDIWYIYIIKIGYEI
jgi:hypothetical protein